MSDTISTLAALAPAAVAQVAIPTETSALVWWLVGLAAAAALFNQIVAAWRNLTGRFSDRPADGPEYVTRPACHQAMKEVADRLDRIDQCRLNDMADLRNLIRSEVGGTHKRVDAILSAVSEVRGELKRVGDRP